MLNRIAQILKIDFEKYCSNVPALDEIAADFIAAQENLYKIYCNAPHIVKVNTMQKKEVKELLIERLMILAGILRVYYLESAAGRKESLLAHGKERKVFECSSTELDRASAEKLCTISEEILKAAKNIKHISRYGITEEDVKDAEAYYNEFKDRKKAPVMARQTVAGRNKVLSAGVKDGVFTLENKIDHLIRVATKEDKPLHDKYFASRKVLSMSMGRPTDKEIAYKRSRKKKTSANRISSSEFTD